MNQKQNKLGSNQANQTSKKNITIRLQTINSNTLHQVKLHS